VDGGAAAPAGKCRKGRAAPAGGIRGRGHLALRVRGDLPRRLELQATLDPRRVPAGGARGLPPDQAGLRAPPRPGAAPAPAPAALSVLADGHLGGLAAGGARVRAAELSAAVEGRVTSPHGTVHVGARGVDLAGVPSIATLVLDASGDGRAVRAEARA